SVFVSDWVSQSYELHGKGAVWHIRAKGAKPKHRPTDLKQASSSLDRPTREAACRTLAKDDDGRQWLRGLLRCPAERIRASALAALIDVGDEHVDLMKLATTDAEVGIREMAVRALVARKA